MASASAPLLSRRRTACQVNAHPSPKRTSQKASREKIKSTLKAPAPRRERGRLAPATTFAAGARARREAAQRGCAALIARQVRSLERAAEGEAIDKSLSGDRWGVYIATCCELASTAANVFDDVEHDVPIAVMTVTRSCNNDGDNVGVCVCGVCSLNSGADGWGWRW